MYIYLHEQASYMLFIHIIILSPVIMEIDFLGVTMLQINML